MRCHKSCVSSYTSKAHTDRHKRRSEAESDASIPRKVTRRLLMGDAAEPFNFRKHRLFCGEDCNVERDEKNPARWRQAYVFRELDKKQALVELCCKRNDDAAAKVKLRLEGVLCDLHAEESRYHLDCRQRFASLRSLPGEAPAPNRHHRIQMKTNLSCQLFKCCKMTGHKCGTPLSCLKDILTLVGLHNVAKHWFVNCKMYLVMNSWCFLLLVLLI